MWCLDVGVTVTEWCGAISIQNEAAAACSVCCKDKDLSQLIVSTNVSVRECYCPTQVSQVVLFHWWFATWFLSAYRFFVYIYPLIPVLPDLISTLRWWILAVMLPKNEIFKEEIQMCLQTSHRGILLTTIAHTVLLCLVIMSSSVLWLYSREEIKESSYVTYALSAFWDMHFKQKVEKSQDRIIIYLTKVGKKLTLALQSTIGVDSFCGWHYQDWEWHA